MKRNENIRRNPRGMCIFNPDILKNIFSVKADRVDYLSHITDNILLRIKSALILFPTVYQL